MRPASSPADAALIKAYEEALERAVPPSPQLVKEYGSKVGALIYPVPCTRPDLAASVGYLARALTFFPTSAMNDCANKVLRYFIDTASAGITFNGHAASAVLEGFSDLPILIGPCPWPTLRPDIFSVFPVLPSRTPASASNASPSLLPRPRSWRLHWPRPRSPTSARSSATLGSPHNSIPRRSTSTTPAPRCSPANAKLRIVPDTSRAATSRSANMRPTES
mmetsp:Transcript_2894/g.9786  ORF Transcript_2894/g.9786 Transcript_2894/m.9786 type:complete len:221 (-) Transcript_2894:184-846(-)